MRRSITATRIIAATLVAVAVVGLVAIGPLQVSPVVAATETDSRLTVKWNDDNSRAAEYQPDRLPSSPHYAEFDDIAITVSQTTGIIDQAVRVNVTGFSGTISSYQSALPIDNAKNFLQAMQCWGPDPLADDFNETCQWGGRYRVENSGLGNSVYTDVTARTGPLDFDLSIPTTHDVPFRTAGGTKISGKLQLVNGEPKYPILDYFGPSTTNEVTSARVKEDGTGYFDFETQSSDQAPQLGCGSEDQLRCWLVVVPRGTRFGGDGEKCSGIRDPANGDELYTYGQRNAIQGGSPVNDQCDYWDNRIVVPLDFTPTGATCEVGSKETRVIGSQLMIGAMSSWQPALCQTLETTFSFASNPDSIARAQLIESGSNTSNIAYTGYPVSSGELLFEDERELLAKTKLTYAPVAISAAVLGFLAESPSGRQENLVLSPRLVAKLLTQSYPFTVPQSQGDPSKNAVHLGAVNRTYTTFSKDPEFQALNPNATANYPYNPAIALPGPSGADAIRQVWRWIFADADARAFMNGTADPAGMTVNPYYLAKGAPGASVPWYLDETGNYVSTPTTKQVGLTNLDGTPQKLTEQALDTFPKNDETRMPLQLSGEKSRFDSIQFAPYSENFLQAARRTFRADPGSKSVWNPNALSLDGTPGDWVSGGAQLPGQKFMISITDTVSALRWGLNNATILGANSDIPIELSNEAMASAMSALEVTSLDNVKQINPALVAQTGYPLTIVTYAGVNLTKSSADERLIAAAMLALVTTVGQQPGTAIGELPDGYLPLTDELTSQAAAAVQEIARYVVPTASPSPSPRPSNSNSNYAQDDFNSGTPGAGDGGGGEAAATDPTVTSGAETQSDARTAVSDTSPIARSGLVIALILGLAGLVIAPILFRGRGFL